MTDTARADAAREMACEVARTYEAFYKVPRAGQERLSDGGGPFGFDIHLALIVDELIRLYGCDALAETGCFYGDTTVYLAARYPQLPVWTCDVIAEHVMVTRHRLTGTPNASIRHCDSPELVADVLAQYQRPLLFLDAHWGPAWPLRRELQAVLAETGIVVIHDFDVGHPRFAYDTYQGIVCGPHLLAMLSDPPEQYFVPAVDADWPLPCQQTGRRAGTGIVLSGLDPAPLVGHPYLQCRPVPCVTHR
ncbi:hypothetical protein ACSNOI_40815 [Actinomadura kijaniata]|uniref:hypothetical protein n=1 Tax=Actinomadura kijaniata TaxID=46161 RepID=UPI003F1CFBAC